MSVNDAFVMSRWIKSLDAADKVTMLADGGGVFADESGLCVKTGKFGGTRLQRLAMIVSVGNIVCWLVGLSGLLGVLHYCVVSPWMELTLTRTHRKYTIPMTAP